jgi:DNA mismatch repair protein MutL
MSATASIELLPPDVAAKIAAGEVVERPANAAKELIENSLDAGATEVRIDLREGGRRLLRVSDNGHGMRSSEVALAMERHSTSKLRTAEDLAAIGTFGFRGEALYSIAAVSQMTLTTRSREEDAATQLVIDAGRVVARSRAAAPVGTSVAVEHLFHNVPARQKFLRAAATEAGQINSVVQRFALAWPEVRFHLTSDGRVVFQSSGSGKLFDVLVQVYGLDAARRMAPLLPDADSLTAMPEADPAADVDFSDGTPYGPTAGLGDADGPAVVVVDGAVGLPTLTRANRTGIQIFVNRRAVEDRSLTHAVVQAYHTLLPVGRFPVAVLLLEVEPAGVDVNVHPQKLQVRFAEERRIFHAVQRAVRSAVLSRMEPLSGALLEGEGRDEPREARRPDPWWHSRWAQERDALTLPDGRLFATVRPDPLPASEAAASGDASAAWPEPADGPSASQDDTQGHRVDAGASSTGEEAATMPPLRVVGQVGATYIVAEGPQGMFLIDQHAAHERILYEQFMASRYGMAAGEPPRQHLLAPLTLHAGSVVAGQVAEHLAALQAVGFEIEPFGGDSFLLRAVPAVLAGEDPEAGLIDIVSSLAGGRSLVGEAYEAQLVKMVCKRAAIKAGQLLSDIEMQELLRQLETCRAPRTCPHGRPTMIQLSAGDLEKAFGRI